MCKMPARKVPLVWSSSKEKVQTLTRFDPTIGRVVNTACPCVVSAEQPTPAISYEFIRISGTVGVNPGSGKFTSNLSPPNVILQFNKTDKNLLDASSYLSTISGSATTLTTTKDPSNYSVFTINSSTDSGTFWSFNCTISSSSGIVNFGDTITLTYS